MSKKKGKKLGRPPRLKDIQKAKDYRAKGLSYRQVGRLMRIKDVKTIFRWVHYKMPEVGKTVDKALDKVLA